MRSLTRLPDRPSMWRTAQADLGAAAGWKVPVVGALLAWMAFQWGFGNDAVLPWLAASTFDLTDDGEAWQSGAVAVAAATATAFVFWGVTQLLDAVLMLLGIRLLPRVIQRISASLSARGLVRPYADLRWSTRWLLAYAAGVSVICLVDVFATGRPGLRRRVPMIIASALMSASSVALVISLVVGATMVATRVPAVADEAMVFLRIARNPFTWIGLFSGLFVVGHLRSRLGRRPQVREN